MRFDIFHSVGRIDSVQPPLSDAQVFAQFFAQARLAEALGFQSVWVAESHFSSEVQKSHPEAVIPHYQGEVGLNADSFQLAQILFAQTRTIGFGTAILNIVGGNGGPIAAADRVNSLAFFNALSSTPRHLDIGFAAGRFPYINAPFGIVPRNPLEQEHWATVRSSIFLEATEIFLRLLRGEVLSSEQLAPTYLPNGEALAPRWPFQSLQLVPKLDAAARAHLTFVLGSHDPAARSLAFRLGDCDLFNLSFTPVAQINALHSELSILCQSSARPWARQRLPRTVLIFIDRDRHRAQERASRCFDTYIEAMRGTAALPPKADLMSRALIGEPQEIREQLSSTHPLGFAADDRLMLWFEFNQSDGAAIETQMRLFATEVLPHYAA